MGSCLKQRSLHVSMQMRSGCKAKVTTTRWWREAQNYVRLMILHVPYQLECDFRRCKGRPMTRLQSFELARHVAEISQIVLDL